MIVTVGTRAWNRDRHLTGGQSSGTGESLDLPGPRILELKILCQKAQRRGEIIGVDIAEVRRNPDRLTAKFPQVPRRLLAGVGLTTGHHHPGAGKDVALGQSQSDSPGTTGNNHRPVCHVEKSVELRTVHLASAFHPGKSNGSDVQGR